MDYSAWRADVFGQRSDADPVSLELLPETESISLAETFNHIDRALVDREVHDLYSRDRIGIGLQLIFSNCCSNMCFCYIEAGDDQRRIQGILNLKKLYANYFDRYCRAPVTNIGNSHIDSHIDFLCYMLWDIFVLFPGNASAGMAMAALDVLAHGMEFRNDNCIVSAIHGLGHWANDHRRAVKILEGWIGRPTTTNPCVISYAKNAATGCIL